MGKGQVRKQGDGLYHIAGKTYELLIGSRAQVHHGTAYKTAGGLVKSDLLQNKHGRIVSKSKHQSAKKQNHLGKAGWTAKKGKFGAVKIESKKARTASPQKKRRKARAKSAKRAKSK